MLAQALKNSKAAPKKHSGWTKGRILTSRLVAVVAFAVILIATHPTEVHGMKDLLLGIGGLYLVLVSIKGRLWCMLYIGGRKNSILVKEGPYARCRNPLYYYSLLGVTGIAAASGMLSVTVITSVLFLAAYHFVIKSEEKTLFNIHGAEFVRYCEEVPRLWSLKIKVPELDVRNFSPKLFHKTFWDSVGFLFGWIAVAAIHMLHVGDNLPQWIFWP